MKISKFLSGAIAVAGLSFGAQVANADLLDDIVANGELKCGVMLDAPPVGLRDADNTPLALTWRSVSIWPLRWVSKQIS